MQNSGTPGPELRTIGAAGINIFISSAIDAALSSNLNYVVLSCHTACLRLFFQVLTRWCLMQVHFYSHVSALNNIT